MKRRMRHTCSDISAFCWQLCKGQEYVCIRLWTTPQPHSTQRPTLAPAKIKGSFASARSGSHRYVCNKRARCTRKAFSKVPKCLKHIKLNCGSILYFIWLASEMHCAHPEECTWKCSHWYGLRRKPGRSEARCAHGPAEGCKHQMYE